jgi:hypothetical protein
VSIVEIQDPKVSYRTATSWIDAFTGAETPILFPTEDTVGVAGIDGWEPAAVIPIEAGGYDVRDEGAVVEDLLVYGNLAVLAPNVTIRRCEVINGSIFNQYTEFVYNNLLIEDSTVRCDPIGTGLFLNKAIGDAGYTARRCAVIDTSEGFRTGASIASGFIYTNLDVPDLERIRIYDCYVRITSPVPCLLTTDYHGDGVQSFDGGNGGVPLTIRNTSIKSVDRETDDGSGSCAGNACVILGNVQSKDLDCDRLLCSGSTIPFRHGGGPESDDNIGGTITRLFVEHDSWSPGYRPIDIAPSTWAEITDWSGYTCTVGVDGQPDTIVKTIPYGWTSSSGPLDPPPEEWPL